MRSGHRFAVRCLSLALVMSYAGAAFAPCPLRAEAPAARTHHVPQPAEHAHGTAADGAADAHEAAGAPREAANAGLALSAPCPCGCQDGAPVVAGASPRLGCALLRAAPPLAMARAGAPLAPPGAGLPESPASAIEHVPLSA